MQRMEDRGGPPGDGVAPMALPRRRAPQPVAGEFRAEIVEEPRGRTLRCHGDLDIAAVSGFRAIARPLCDADLTVDLRGLDFVDSSGLREIVRVRDAIAGDAHQFTVLARPQSLLWHLIDRAALNGVLNLRPAE